MDIPSESVQYIVMLITLGIIIAIIAFLAFEGGIFRNMDFVTGFFR